MAKRTVAITGGTKGIGKVMAAEFSKRGWNVAIMGRSAPKKSSSKKLFHFSGDARYREEMETFVRQSVKRFGKLDAFVNCAGLSIWKSLDEVDDDFLSRMVETNVYGAFWGAQSAAKVLKKGGAIVNVSSLAGKRGSANNSVYCATKFALNGITQSLAKELGSKGIRVNAVCPVYVQTPMILHSLTDPQAPPAGKNVKAYLKNFAETQTALKRLPTEKEVFSAVEFFCSPQSSAITGQCLNVDCGTLPQ